MLATFDIIHSSLLLHTVRVAIYIGTIFLFYYAAWFSYDLTGDEGYRSTCPAKCKFQSYTPNWVSIVFLGAPIYLFIIADLVREIKKRHNKANPQYQDRDRKKGRLARYLKLGMDYGRFLAWVYCIIDFIIGLSTFIIAWMVKYYSGMILTSDFDENTWGFGQLVAIILISLPFITGFEEYKGKFLNYCLPTGLTRF